jgi:hypothetical protein
MIMVLQKQLMPVVCPQGINTKIGKQHLPIQSAVELDNVRLTKQGVIQKRFGYDSISSSISADETPITLMSFQGKQLLCHTIKPDHEASLYGFAEKTSAWEKIGEISPATFDFTPLIQDSQSQSEATWAVDSGYLVVGYIRSVNGSVYGAEFRVFDSSTLIPIQNMVLDYGGYPTVNIADTFKSVGANRAHVVAGGGCFYCFSVSGSTLSCSVFVASNKRLLATVSVATNLNATYPTFDAYWNPVAQRVLVAWNTSTPSIQLCYLLPTGAVNTVYGIKTIASTNANGCITVGLVPELERDPTMAYRNSNLVLWSELGGTTYIKYSVFDSQWLGLQIGTSSFPTGSPVRALAIVPTEKSYSGVSGLTSFWIAAEKAYTFVNYQPTQNYIDVYDTSFNTGMPRLISCGLASRAYKKWLLVAHESQLQPTYFLLNVDTGRVVGKTLALKAGGIAGSLNPVGTAAYTQIPCPLPEWDGTSTILGMLSGVSTDNGQIVSQRGLCKLSTVWDAQVSSAEAGSLVVAGSLCHVFDGVHVSEAGFNLFPENCSAVVSNAGVGSPHGLYGLAVTYQYQDAQGVIWESLPWLGSATLGASNHTITITVTQLNISSKSSLTPISIVVYRTVANGTIYYRETSMVSPTLVDKTQFTTSVAINPPVTDTAILSNPLLYTTGGVLENDQYPSCKHANLYRGRIIFSGLEDQNRIAFTKTFFAGTAPEFNATLTQDLISDGESVAYTATLDEKLILFKPTGIYAMSGEGPLNTGLNNDFQTPISVATDVGSLNAHSCVLYAQGLLFKSNKGLYQIDRGMAVSYVGAPLEAYNGLTITGGCLIDDANEVRWTTTGATLVFNSFFNQWYTHTNLESVSSVVVLGKHTLVRTDGRVVRETKAFSDDASWVTSSITTGWMQPQQQGFERVYRILLLGELLSAHKLSVDLGYNFDTYFSETFQASSSLVYPLSTFGSSNYGVGLYGGAYTGRYQLMVFPSLQKCQALRLRVYDGTDGGVMGEGFSLTGILLQVGVKEGTAKVPASQRMAGSGRA